MARTFHIAVDEGGLPEILGELVALLPELPDGFHQVVEALVRGGKAIAVHDQGCTAGTAEFRVRLEPTEALLGLLAAARALNGDLDIR
jgi:hypothetical protein